MNNLYFERAGQKDREFEELLCLAYLFTHSVDDEIPEGSEILLADDTESFANYFCN